MPRSSPARRALVAERLARQGLGAPAAGTVAEAVAVTTAVQAQDPAASRLGVRVRSSGLTDASVSAAIAQERSVVRTWLHRGTVHLVTAEDLRWLVRLVGPSIERRYRTRWRQLGLSDALLDRSLEVLPEVLADGPMERQPILDALAERGLRPDDSVPGDPYLHTHVLVHASCVGLVCRAHDRGRAAHFTLVEQWLPGSPHGPSGDDALAELARRYFAAFSPATPADFTAWSGLAAGRAVELVRDELTEADVAGRPGFRLGEVQPALGVRLLPMFDNYVLGYQDRTALMPDERFDDVYQGGIIRATLVIDGAVAGTWRLDKRAGRVDVAPFAPLRRADVRGVEREVADLGRFLEIGDLELAIRP